MKIIKKFFVCLFILLSFNFILLYNVNASDVPNIQSPSALLMDLNSGKILYERNINNCIC